MDCYYENEEFMTKLANNTFKQLLDLDYMSLEVCNKYFGDWAFRSKPKRLKRFKEKLSRELDELLKD